MLTKEDKVSIVNKEVGVMRTKKTKQRIHDAIQSWNKTEKITADKVAQELSLGEATVGRHWREFKILIQDVNKDKSTSK